MVTFLLATVGCGSASSPSDAAGSETSTVDDASSDSDSTDGAEVGDVSVTGGAVATGGSGGVFTDASLDPAIGTKAPAITGTNFDGDAVTIAADGRPKAVYYLAHWCSHCQAEVELIMQLAADGMQPAGMDIYAVAIAVSDERPNYPPSAWLESFPGTVMRDSASNTAAEAAGVSGIPYTLYLDGENRITARSIGSLTTDQIVERWNALAAGT
ncbi:MAG: redoxin domain-containing protein [Acidimicrobiales bacterium]|nr:redoxin domain-containing protein [Acidimicrobiales bacterium]